METNRTVQARRKLGRFESSPVLGRRSFRPYGHHSRLPNERRLFVGRRRPVGRYRVPDIATQETTGGR